MGDGEARVDSTDEDQPMNNEHNAIQRAFCIISSCTSCDEIDFAGRKFPLQLPANAISAILHPGCFSSIRGAGYDLSLHPALRSVLPSASACPDDFGTPRRRTAILASGTSVASRCRPGRWLSSTRSARRTMTRRVWGTSTFTRAACCSWRPSTGCASSTCFTSGRNGRVRSSSGTR